MFLSADEISRARLSYIIYLVFSKILYFSGFLILLVLMFNKINSVIGSSIWAPIVELNFTAYLQHMFWIVTFFASNAQTPNLTMTGLIFDSIAILFTSYVFSMPYAFFMVFPINNLSELILFTVQRQNKPKPEYMINSDASDKFGYPSKKESDTTLESYKVEKFK